MLTVRYQKILPFLICIIIYKIILDYIYIIVNKEYPYWYSHNEHSLTLTILSWVVLGLFIVPLIKYLNGEERISDTIMVILFFFSIIPFTTLIKFGEFSLDYILGNVVFWAILIIVHGVLKRYPKKVVHLVIGKKSINEKWVKFIVWIFCASVLIIWAVFARFRINFGIMESEVIRLEAISYNIPIVLEYIYLWSQVIIPILLAFFLRKRNVKYTVVCLMTQLISYCINGMKLTLFVTIIVFIMAFLKKVSLQQLNFFLSFGICIVCLIGIVEYMVNGTCFIAGIIIMRMMFMPNSISYYYFDFFKSNVPDYFRASFLSHFGFKSPYDNLPHIIADIYYHSPNMGCNDGLIGDACANFGMAGIIILPIAMAIFFKILDNYTDNMDSRMYIGCAFVIGLRLISSYLVTNLISYGMIIMIIIFGVLNRTELNKAKRNDSESL